MWSFLVFLKGEKNFGVFVVCCCCCCCAGQQRTRQQVIMGDVSVGDGDLESFGDLTEEGEFLERNFPADEAVNVVAEAMGSFFSLSLSLSLSFLSCFLIPCFSFFLLLLILDRGRR